MGHSPGRHGGGGRWIEAILTLAGAGCHTPQEGKRQRRGMGGQGRGKGEGGVRVWKECARASMEQEISSQALLGGLRLRCKSGRFPGWSEWKAPRVV